MNKIILVLIVSISISFSCNSQKFSKQNSNIYDSLEKLEVIKYFEDSSVKNNSRELFVKNLAKFIGLPKIDAGANGLYIRIWIWNGERKYVVSLSNDSGIRNCQVKEFNIGQGDTSYYIIIFHEWYDLLPKSGWDNFFNVLSKHNIPFLESGTIQNKRKDAATGLAYVEFEIAQPNNYRYYEYLEPSFYRYVDSASNNVDQFLHFFNKEMKAKVYNPPAPTRLFAKPK